MARGAARSDYFRMRRDSGPIQTGWVTLSWFTRMPLSPGDKLGPYEILAPIGAGGMGEVWKARDTRLNRIVAVKRLKDNHSARFEQEARAIAALNHPHICQIHDIGPDYLVLEYIEGQPLQGPLAVEEAVRVAGQIAEALDSAHCKGVLHRDLKPGNIMLTSEGSVKLLDFGLAKQVSDAEGTATMEGMAMGTAAYMAPEQVEGRPLDARSDVFSFGVVLYELLSGRRAFRGASSASTMAAIMHREPAPLDAPAALKQIVQRCLAKAPGQRYQSMAEIRAALASIPREHAAPQPSIAVLPFANMSREADDEYFSDGLAEEIINALAQLPGLKVIARTSAFAFKGKNEDIRKIAEALGVTNVLEGSVRRAGNRLRITAQLIHAADGTHLWSQRFDREMTDVFAIQDELSAAIAGQLRVSLAETPAAGRAPTKVAAYEAFLEGQYHWNKITPQSLQKALECYGRALAIDPGYAPAYAGLAQSYIMPGQSGMVEPRPFLLKARAAAERGLALDPDLAEAHAMLGASIALLDYDWAASERHFLRALELNPSSYHVWGPYATFWLAPQGRPDEAAAGFDRVLELDPLNPLADFSKGLFLYYGRRYEAAAVEIRKSLDLNPGFSIARNVLASLYAFQEKFDEALSVAQREVQLSGGRPRLLWMMGLVLAMAGRAEEARRVLEDLQGPGRDSYVNPVHVAAIYAQLGEKDAAFKWVEKAVEERVNMLMLKASPVWDPLRSDPRYTALLRRMNLV